MLFIVVILMRSLYLFLIRLEFEALELLKCLLWVNLNLRFILGSVLVQILLTFIVFICHLSVLIPCLSFFILYIDVLLHDSFEYLIANFFLTNLFTLLTDITDSIGFEASKHTSTTINIICYIG